MAEGLVARKNYFSMLSPAQQDGVCLLVALHDLGKISECFRRQISSGEQRMPGHLRHDVLTYRHFQRLASELMAALKLEDQDVYQILTAAVAGHHGQPVDIGLRSLTADRLIGPIAAQSARDLVLRMIARFPDASLAGLDKQSAKDLSFAVAGFTSHADWIASDPERFPPAGVSHQDMQAYNRVARDRATDALDAAGFRLSRPLAYAGIAAFTAGRAPRPLQALADNIASSSSLPDLVIIEDQTGAGKTEASLTLANAFMASGKARGVFFALPTMATSNALHDRLQRAAPLLLDEGVVGLVHHGAKRWVEGSSGPSSPSEWLLSETRRGLLADIAVGTIDQAMFGVLRTRFHALRHHALRDKVLVVDEVHEADPYMQEIVQRLLAFRGAQRLPTILMSATLPLELRERYAAAYRSGRPQVVKRSLQTFPQKSRESMLPLESYPSLSTLSFPAEGPQISQAAVAAASRRRVSVLRLEGLEACLDRLTKAREMGANAVWIRNSVDEAIDAWQKLQDRGVPARLLHSRFTARDRRRIEKGLLRDFGPERADLVSGRPGEIVIATQVIEAGLDLDFDVMISDLAPMASLLQRLGRQYRHLWKGRPDELPVDPIFYVNAPDPGRIEPGDWLEGALGRGRFIYDERVMWRTLDILMDKKAVELPEDTRKIVETSLCEAGVPKWIKDRAQAIDGQALADRHQAAQIVIDPPSSDYSRQSYGQVHPEEDVTTRLGRPQVSLALISPELLSSQSLRADIDDICVKVDLRRSGLNDEGRAALLEAFGDVSQIVLPEGIVPVVLTPAPRPDVGEPWVGDLGKVGFTYSDEAGLRFA